MVVQAVSDLSGKIRAEIKSDNKASIAVAQFAGMSLEKESNGVLFFCVNK